MTNVWISAAGLCGATMIGSILGFGIKELPHKWNDTVLGYCAGVMLAASTLGLIVPAFESVATPWWLVALGVMVGALFLNVLDLVTPHLHHVTGLDAEEHRNNSTLNHILLFVMAIAIHKFPEGIAAGVSMSEGEASSWTVSFGIALQNIPEGMVIIAPLLLAGVKHSLSPWPSVCWKSSACGLDLPWAMCRLPCSPSCSASPVVRCSMSRVMR